MDALDTGAKVLELQREWERSRAFLAELEAGIASRRAEDEKPAPHQTVLASNEADQDDITTFAFDGDNSTSLNTDGPHGSSSTEAPSCPPSQGAPSSSSHARRPSISQINMRFEPSEDHCAGTVFGDDWAAASALRAAFMLPRQPKPPLTQHAASFRQRAPPPVQRARLLRASTFGSSSPGLDDQVLPSSSDSWRTELAHRRETPATTAHAAASPSSCVSTADTGPPGVTQHPAPEGGAAFKPLRRYSMDYDVSRGSTSLMPTVLGIAARRMSIGSLAPSSEAPSRPLGFSAGSSSSFAFRRLDLFAGEAASSANSSVSGDKPSGRTGTSGGSGVLLAPTMSAPTGVLQHSESHPQPSQDFPPLHADPPRMSSSLDAILLRSAVASGPRKAFGESADGGRLQPVVLRNWQSFRSSLSDAGGSIGFGTGAGTGTSVDASSGNNTHTYTGEGEGEGEGEGPDGLEAVVTDAAVPRPPSARPPASLPRSIVQNQRFRRDQQQQEQLEQQYGQPGPLSSSADGSMGTSPRAAAAATAWRGRLVKSVSMPRPLSQQRREDSVLQLHQSSHQQLQAPLQPQPPQHILNGPLVGQPALVGFHPHRAKSMHALRLRGIPEDPVATEPMTRGSATQRSELGNATHAFQRMGSGGLHVSAGGSSSGRFSGLAASDLVAGGAGNVVHGNLCARRSPRYSWGTDAFSSISEV